MTQHFNNLTPAEAERLAMLAEECAEVIQVIGKIQRHGYESDNPLFPGTTNRKLLGKELTDVSAVMYQVVTKDKIQFGDSQKAWTKKMQWTHHQLDLDE
jgi:NTP pyrophosphatase (non-canonical NTP hydrolase)